MSLIDTIRKGLGYVLLSMGVSRPGTKAAPKPSPNAAPKPGAPNPKA